MSLTPTNELTAEVLHQALSLESARCDTRYYGADGTVHVVLRREEACIASGGEGPSGAWLDMFEAGVRLVGDAARLVIRRLVKGGEEY